MGTLIIEHKVKDYASWRPAYDANESSRSSAGITNARVFRKAEDGNVVVVMADVADIDKARAWASGSELKDAMQRAGVVGAPKLHFIK